MRAVCAFLVVLIHAPKDLVGWSLRPFEVIAVPMFFLLSGFLSYSTDTTKLYERAKKSTKKLIVFTLSLNLLYYILLFPLKGNLLDSWKDWLNLIFWGRSIMSTLWFMTDLATGWFLITLICKFGLERLLPFCIVVIPLQVILSGYLPYLGVTEFMGISVETYFHTVPYSLGYLSLGFVLSRWQGKATLTTAALVSGVLLFVATSFVENAIVGIPRGVRGNTSQLFHLLAVC